MDPEVLKLIAHFAAIYGVPPAAAAAVASTEGGVRWGGEGDTGTSFGPFQLHIGGANPYDDPQQAAAFANSPKGIEYAIRKMAESGAANAGSIQEAIEAIVRNFERPADPDAQVNNALAALPQVQQYLSQIGAIDAAAGVGPPLPFSGAPDYGEPADPFLDRFAGGPVGRGGASQEAMSRLGPISDRMVATQPNPQAQPPQIPTPEQPPPDPSDPAQYPPNMFASAEGAFPAGSPGSGKVDPRLLKLSQTFGLQITSGFRTPEENDAVGGSPTSYHMKGKAVDVAVSPKVQEIAAFAQANPWAFTEFFFDPLGWYIKNGQIIKGGIGGHGDHLHIVLADAPKKRAKKGRKGGQ